MNATKERINETRFRYIHHKTEQDVAIVHNQAHSQVHKLELNSVPSDTIIMEKLEDGVVKSLRILHINYRRVTPLFFNAYSSVDRLEIGCSLSIYWLFRQLQHFPKLKIIRFGRQMFMRKDEEENISQTFRQHNSVVTVEINYDHHIYTKLPSSEKSSVESKLTKVLKLTRDYFPNLQFCNIQVPKSLESELDEFSCRFLKIYHAGEKRTTYADAPILFLCTSSSYKRKHEGNSSSSHQGRRSSSSSSRESFSSPLDDRPDLLHPRDQEMSAYTFLKQPKLEVNEDDQEIVVLETSAQFDDSVDITQSNNTPYPTVVWE